MNLLFKLMLRAGGAPLQEIDYLVLLGSSTTVESFTSNAFSGDMNQSARSSFTAQGIDIPIVMKATGGANIAYLNANVTSFLTDFALTGKKIGVLIHIGSNDIGVTSYASMSQPTKDAMLADLNGVIDKVLAMGPNFYPMLATSNSRKFTEALYEDWATLFFDPIITARTPAYKVAGEPAFDYSKFYFDNKDVANWWQADNVHPQAAAIPNQVYTAQQLKKVAKPPALSAKEKFIFKYDGGATVGGINSLSGTGTQTLASVRNNSANIVAGVSYGYTGASGSSNTVRPNVGNYDVGISRKELQSWYLWTNSGNLVHTFTGGAPYANRTGTARFTFNTSNAARVSRFTIGGSFVDLTGDASGLQTASLPFTSDGSGVVVVTVSPASGSFSSINGLEFEFD